MRQLIIDAITKLNCLTLRYDGYERLVEPHAVGVTKEGHGIVRVWQVSGGSVSHEPTGWKLLRTDEIGSAHLALDPSLAPRPGYRRGDPAMARVIAQV